MREKWLNLVEASAVFVVSVLLIPHLHSTWPHVPGWVLDVVSPILALLIVGVVSLLWWQQPHIVVAWKTDGDPNALADLRVVLRAPIFASEPFEVSFRGRPKGFLTILLMWWLRSHDLRLTVRPVGAPVVATVTVSSPINPNTSVGAADFWNGFSMRVVAPAQPTTWMWAKVFFQGTTEVHDTFQLEYGATALTKRAQLLSKLVRVSSDARNFHIN